MANYRLSHMAKADLIRIHQYGMQSFGTTQADLYFDALFQAFEEISKRPFTFEAVDHIKAGYRRCVCGVDSIYFKVTHTGVDIMAIVGKQDLDTLFEEV